MNNKPHIVLLGGQTLPNNIPLRELNATEVRVIHSPETRSQVKALWSTWRGGCFTGISITTVLSLARHRFWQRLHERRSLRGQEFSCWEGN